MFIHDVLGLIIEEKMQNGSRRIPSGVFYQNEGHTVNVYNELYETSESLLCLHADAFVCMCLYVRSDDSKMQHYVHSFSYNASDLVKRCNNICWNGYRDIARVKKFALELILFRPNVR